MNLNTISLLSVAFCVSWVQAKKKKVTLPKGQTGNSNITQYIFIAFGVVALIGALVYLLDKRSQLMRAQKLRSIRRALEVKQQSKKNKSCTMTQMQKDQAIAWFKKQNWNLQQSNGKDKNFKIPLQIVNIKRKQQSIDGSKYLKDYYDAFYVQMKGGSTKIFGVIMFEKYYPTIIFEKSVSNSKNENGNYNYKFFDGYLKKGQFEGRWYTTNDAKIQIQRQALKQKERNAADETISDGSFSKGQRESEDSSPTIRSKQQRGSFKLYHV